MSRNIATADGQAPRRSLSSLASLAVILLLAIGFWAGALWGGATLLKLVLN